MGFALWECPKSRLVQISDTYCIYFILTSKLIFSLLFKIRSKFICCATTLKTFLFFIFFYTGHPLFQVVSHDLSYCPIILLPALVLWAILLCLLAYSNQCLCDPPKVNHSRADYCPRLLVSL